MAVAQPEAGLVPPASASRIRCTVDLDRDGKRHGNLIVPHSRNESAWGCIQVPITVVRGGPGPTILLTGGSHGDEYEGPVALIKLARALDPSRVKGRVIVVPSMNLPAVRDATRLSPLDGLNMNRIFPGRRDGTVTSMIAHYVFHELVRRADVVVDLHSGGKTLDFVPSVVMHELEDPALMERTLAALRTFGSPLALVLKELDNEGMLDTVVEESGRVFLSTELGGCGTTTPERIAIADRGVHNLLCHFGVVDAEPWAGAVPTRLMHTPDEDSFLTAEEAGLCEPLVELGAEVAAGTPVFRIHSFERPELEPAVSVARRAGVLYSRHAPGLVHRGDCLAVIAVDYAGAATRP